MFSPIHVFYILLGYLALKYYTECYIHNYVCPCCYCTCICVIHSTIYVCESYLRNIGDELDRSPEDNNVSEYERPSILHVADKCEQQHHSTSAQMRVRNLGDVDEERGGASCSEETL